jgi:elongation factor Ts
VSSTVTYKPSPDEIKRLRDETGAGVLDCRRALQEANGDHEAAKKHLADSGMSKAAKKSDRVAKEGLVVSYIHHNDKAGVLLELNCETDFVARNERFKQLAHDLAKHVFATNPAYVDRAAVPQEQLVELKGELAKEVPAGKPPEVAARIVEGKLNKWYGDHVLVDQPFIMNEDQTVGELIGSVVGVLGENIAVRRFTKFAIGES